MLGTDEVEDVRWFCPRGSGRLTSRGEFPFTAACFPAIMSAWDRGADDGLTSGSWEVAGLLEPQAFARSEWLSSIGVKTL
jgi:hypothetical protein